MNSRSTMLALAFVTAAGLAGCSTDPLTGYPDFHSWRPPLHAAAQTYGATDPFLNPAGASEQPTPQPDPPGRVTLQAMTAEAVDDASANPFEPGRGDTDPEAGRPPSRSTGFQPVPDVTPGTTGWRPVRRATAQEPATPATGD